MGSIIILAPPAAGKGTQSKLISEKYNLVHISTGDLLREEIQKKSEIGLKIDNKIKNGELVSDDIILELLSNKISNLDNYILDGFPRNVTQAIEYKEMLERLNKKISHVFYIDLSKEISEDRILSRISCSYCGKVYNTSIDENKPKIENICDNCQHELIRREDDTLETFEKRYQVYLSETKPLIEFYTDEKLLYRLNGALDKDTIFKEICSVIEGDI